MARQRRLPPMNALKAFDAAARYKGFTAASRELYVSAGAISRHVANLEEYVGLSLFERRHNDVHLTPMGEQYFARIRSALDVIEDASQRLIEGPNPRQVRVKTLPTFAMRWLIPRLPAFTALFPRVEIQLSTSVAQIEEIDWELDGVDIAVHFSISDISTDFCDLLFETELQAVCSPELANVDPGIHQPADIAEHMLLYTMNGFTQWRQWLEGAGLEPELAKRRMKFENSALALQGAVDGVGIALGETVYVQADIDAGRLVSPIDHRIYTGNSYFMSANPNRVQMPGVQAFREWLLSEIHAARPTLA